MSGLTTHILDTAKGVPAAGVKITLFRVVGSEISEIGDCVTNQDGRTNQPMLAANQMKEGVYQLHFEVGAYFGVADGDISFLKRVVIEFGIVDSDQHYHVPLLISPYGYSTYRGS